MTFEQVLEFVMMWTAGLLVWANIAIWGTVIAIVVLSPIIGFVVGFVRGVRS
jgi:uncharacterized membrane protein